MQNVFYFFPFRVKMLDANILLISSSSFKNQSTFLASTRRLSRRRAIQSLVSFADFNDVLK